MEVFVDFRSGIATAAAESTEAIMANPGDPPSGSTSSQSEHLSTMDSGGLGPAEKDTGPDTISIPDREAKVSSGKLSSVVGGAWPDIESRPSLLYILPRAARSL